MGWNAQDIEKLRNGQNKRTAAPRSAAQTVSNARGWTADDIAALRSGTGTKKTTEAWENRSAGAGTRLSGTGSLSGQVLAQMMGSAGGTGSTNPKLQLAVPQTKQSTQAYPGKSGIVTGQSAAQTTPLRGGTAQPEWLTKAQPENRTAEKASAPAVRATGTVKPTEQQRIAGIARGEEGQYAQTAQKVKQYTEDLKATDDFSDFDRLNQWMDADPRHRKLVSLMRAGMGGQSYAERNNAMQPRNVSGAAASAAVPEKSAGGRGYTDAELLEKDYSRKEISEARQYIEDFDVLPGWQRAARRTANTIGGIGDTVASSVFLAGETGVQSVKNAAATSENWKQLQQSVQDDDRQRTLLNLMTGGKTRYAEQDHSMPLAGSSQSGSDSNAYTDAELMAKGYTRQEIYNMRARIAGTKVKDSVDPEKSLGYQLYKRGQNLTAAAQAGLSPIAKQALGIVSSAGENLAVAGINPAAVLPVLSAQGGAEAMGQSIEKGESAGKTLAGGLAKFGAGWAINSVGAADLARTMGSDYAKDTLAGKLADVVRSVAADGRLAQQYPAIANTISGGVDNAMQAFVETYADKAIDAALGDSEAAQSMFTAETFLNAVESGLAGGASGALGGAVGTGLAKANGGDASIVGNVKRAYYEGQVERAQQALQDEVRAQEPGTAMQQTPEEAAADTRQPTAATQETVQPEVTGTTSGFATMQDTAPMAQSENPAVQQLAAAVQDGQLTSKTINLFTPNAANEANRAAFAEEYGVELPETAAKTQQVLREMTTQQRAAQAPAAAIENATVEAQNTAAIVEKMEADRSVQQAQTESELGRSGAAVENTGERVESSPAEQPGGMRETYGLTQQSLNAKQREVQQELTRWKISDGASETISRNMPAEIGDAERYAAAASSLYRLGQMEDVTTFDKAMELAQGMRGLAVNTDYVLAQDGGRQALNLAWLQGHGELEAGKAQLGSLGGSLTKESISGSGRVLYKGTMRTVNEVGTQLIELNAKATSTDAVMKAVLQGNDRVKAYVDTETGRIFFSDRAEDVFGTILHEDYHWYNSLDAEGAQALQQHALEYLAKSEGFEGIDEMIREKLSDYEQQELTYEEAAEELVADAWRGIFSDEASFKRWVEFQRGQAEKNAGKAGTIRKVMTKVKEMLTDIISRAKEVLAKDPENKAALKAQRLAEAEKRVLQDEYFAHAEKAMDNLRAAKESAAALENKGAAKGTRYEINPEYAGKIDEWDKEGRSDDEVFILGRTGDTLQQLGARENDIYMNSDKINRILHDHPEMTLEEIKRIPEVLDDPVMVLTSQNKGRSRQNTRLVMFGSVKAQDGRPVLCVLDLRPVEDHIVLNDMQKVTSAYTKDNDPIGFVRRSDVLYISESKEKTTELFRTLGFQMPSELQFSGLVGSITYGNQDVKLDGVKFTELENIKPSGGTHVESEDSRSRLPESFTETFGKAHMESEDSGSSESKISNQSIAQEAAENKGNDGTLKKNVRYQLSEADELTKLRDEQQQLDEQRRELKEERSAWLGSDAVKEIEAKKKALGTFSAEAKAYRDSEEYQNYLAKRKDYNARMAQLEDQSAVLNGRIKEAGARMQQQNAEKGKAEQAVYDAKAEAHGGKAEYRRVLAKERFGTTEDFRRAGYILPDGQMLDFAQNDRTRDTDHREIMSVFGSAEVKNGTEALNEFLLDGNVRVMAEAPGVDLSADTAPTTQQLEQIWRMVQELGGEKRQFTLDISTADGRVAAGKEYSGRVDADRVVREIREYYQTGELAQESDLAKFRYQLAEQADRDAKRNDQQTASRTIADKAAALDTLSQFFGLTRGVKVSRTAIEGLASRWAKANGSKVDRAKLARETEVLVEYLKADGADMNKAEALAETLAGEVLDGATYRNSELWDEYPELHKLEYTVNKTGQAKAELVKAYGSWSEAVAEARKHGVCLRQADGVRDGNPAQQYESVTDVKGKKAELTHAQLCSLYMHLHNTDSLNHLMNGGLVIPDAKLYNKGDIEQAYQKGQTVHLGMLTDADGIPTADSILQTVEAAMTDYDRAWCADMKEFFDNYTAKLINETSLQLVGYQRATVKNYYPIAVDKSVLATQIDGLNLDATIEGRGFLKNRVKSSQPILLEECSNVVQRSLRDTADYAGLAAPIRDVQKILNSGVETREGLKNLKNGIIKEQWGGDAVNYIDNLLKDLQKKSRQRKSTLQWLGNLSGKYAGAVLTLNPGVALAQAASLPTAAAVLGGDTMAAVVPFVKNASPKQRAALEAEIKAHGDVLLDWRKRGSQNGELASIGKQKTLAEKGMDKLPNWLTGWINGMDEVTVAALWEGSKRYVQNHTAEFEGAEVTGSPAYWEAVNRTYQKVIEQTQPNYTVMQRAGIQRNPDGMAKALTMFTTQRFQNYGILADAVGDYKAQAERYRAESSAENKAEVQRAGQQLRRAVASQTVQTVTFALMKMGVGFVLHRWKDLQDENGDMTLKSLLKRLGELCMESFAGTGLYGSEIYGFASNAVTGNDYDVVSAANLGLVNEFAAAAGKFAYELRKDIGGMDEDEAEKHDRKLWTLAGNVVEAGLQALGVPYANGKKFVEAAAGWYGTLQDWKKSGKYGNFDSLPQSATGQYDRLYNAYRNKDVDEARAATEKLTEMGKDGEIYKQLKTRLKKYDPNIQKAAEAQVNGDEVQRYQLETQTIEQIYEVMGIRRNVKEDAPKREAVIDCVTGAVNAMADEQLKGDGGSVTDDLVEALDSGRAQDVQQELNRLMTAGKDAKNLKSKITEVCKPEYLAGSDTDKQQMEEMLLGLTDAEGNALYTEKTFDTWTRNAEKAAEKEDVTADPYAALK